MVEIRCLPIACSLMARLWHFYQHGWYHYEPYWSLRKISISISLTFSFPMLKVPYCAINHPQVVPCQPFCWTFVLGVPTSPIFKRLMKKVTRIQLPTTAEKQINKISNKSTPPVFFLMFKVHQSPMKYSFQQSRESLPCVQGWQGALEPNQ